MHSSKQSEKKIVEFKANTYINFIYIYDAIYIYFLIEKLVTKKSKRCALYFITLYFY